MARSRPEKFILSEKRRQLSGGQQWREEAVDVAWQLIHLSECIMTEWLDPSPERVFGNQKWLFNFVRLNTVILVYCCTSYQSVSVCLAESTLLLLQLMMTYLSYITILHCAIRAEGSEESGHNGFIIPWDHPWEDLWIMENEVDQSWSVTFCTFTFLLRVWWEDQWHTIQAPPVIFTIHTCSFLQEHFSLVPFHTRHV